MFEYGIFITVHGPATSEFASWPMRRWMRVTNGRTALRLAKVNHGYVVRKQYDRSAWDAPTFQACGEIIADFRIKE